MGVYWLEYTVCLQSKRTRLNKLMLLLCKILFKFNRKIILACYLILRAVLKGGMSSLRAKNNYGGRKME